MEEHWESQARLILRVTAVGLCKNALNLSSVVPKMYNLCTLYPICIYTGCKSEWSTHRAATGTETSEDNNPMSLLLRLPLASAGLSSKFSFP